ncbi:hypothetical protein HDZ31DRAFT_68373 [Schizophyllum fasciatum]
MYATPSATPTPPNYPQAPTPTPPRRRPASIGELAERALENLWDDRRELKYYLRLAEKYRKEGKEAAMAGDTESAFVAFARAATLVLDKLPTHRDYKTVLNDKHRHNLGLNGQDILDCLGQLKPVLVERHEQWILAHPEDAEDADRTPDARQQHLPTRETADRQQQELEDERMRWQRQREDIERERREQQERAQSAGPSSYSAARNISSASAQAAVSAARQAAGSRAPSTAPGPSTVSRGADLAFATSPPPPQAPVASRHEQQQEAMRRQADEIQRRREEQKRQERARQIEAETAARVAREQQAATAMITSTSPQPPHSQYSTPQPSQQSTPQPPAPQYPPTGPQFPTPHHPPSGSHHAGPHYPVMPGSNAGTRGPSPQPSRPPSPPVQYTGRQEPAPPMVMPLENPAYDDDTTDTESIYPSHTRRPSKLVKHRTQETSPPSVGQGAHIQYPNLMSQHQRGQGYAPSIMSNDDQGAPPNSSAPPPMPATSNLLFDGKQFERAARPLYSSDLLPKPSHPAYGGAPAPAQPQPRSAQPQAKETPKPGQLKRVTVPRETLPRFLAIAKINTSLNLETCGLLLGKDRGHKYVVTTLLIPKQHATSDTCTTDDEELVLEFTEERSLITLGWIHTHPSQSCFMSSVDLHTHSGFQRMLPESFAIVCAPRYTPT